MKIATIRLAIFSGILGAVFGFGVAYLLVGLPAKRQRADGLVYMCEGDLIVLGLLQQGKVEDLIQRKEKCLATEAQIRSTSLRDHPGSGYFLWEIRDYFRSTSNAIPEGLSNIFRELPASKPYPKRLYYSGS